jgi:hypothetical protein
LGVFGTGLYSGDFAMDLRSTIRAVSRLPFVPDQLVEILCDSEPGAAKDSTGEDHTTFWLVVADQFAKRGIVSDRVRNKALEIINHGLDLSALQKLGMSPSDLRKRKKTLDELHARLIAPPLSKTRPVLKAPQPFLMEIGDVFVYPTCGGDCINPYFGSKEMYKFHHKDGSVSWQWQQDGWAALIIVDRGRAFDFLSWYRPLTIAEAIAEKPSLENLRRGLLWKLSLPGTCTATQVRRMEFEKIGALSIDDAKLRHAFPDMRPGTHYAVNDISIANRLRVAPALPERALARPGEVPNRRAGQSYPTIIGIAQILSERH